MTAAGGGDGGSSRQFRQQLSGRVGQRRRQRRWRWRCLFRLTTRVALAGRVPQGKATTAGKAGIALPATSYVEYGTGGGGGGGGGAGSAMVEVSG